MAFLERLDGSYGTGEKDRDGKSLEEPGREGGAP